MADSGSKMMLSVGGCEMALTEATLLPMVMQELSIQYPWYEPNSEQLKTLALQQTQVMLQELQKNGNITSGMQQLTMQDTPAISKPALATIGHQQEPAPLYAPGCAEKEGSSVDKSSGKSVPLVNRLSPRMPPTPMEQRGKRLTLAPTSQAVLSGSGQHEAHVHPSSAVTSPNAMTLQGLQSEHPEKALCRKKMSNERIKPADPNSAQGEEGQRTGTRSVEPSVNDANSRYIPYLTTEENWDDECEPFPKFYVGNFKPAKFIFSSSYIGEERREQSKSSGVPERSEPASQRQASGHTNQSSRGQKQRATRPACEKVTTEGNCHQNKPKPREREQWVKVGKKGRAVKQQRKKESS